MAKILALDYGARKIGLAVGDTDERFAFRRPAILLGSDDAVWPALSALIEAEQPAKIIVGLPLDTDGRPGPHAELVQSFIRQAAERFGREIIPLDERLTTQAVQREQAGRSLPRGMEDSLVAQQLLESYFSRSA